MRSAWTSLLVLALAGCNLIYSWGPLDADGELDDGADGEVSDDADVPIDVDGDGPDETPPDTDAPDDSEIDGDGDGDGDGPDVPEGDAEEEGEGGVCGNGVVEPGEDCDRDPPRTCATSCGSSGLESCVGCRWAGCVPPVETCNGADDDCDGLTDEVGGTFTCGDGCCNGGEDPCSCVADCHGSLDPSVPVPRAPANGARTGTVHAPGVRATLRPLFRWSAATGGCGPATYDVAVDDSCATPGFAGCGFPSPEATGVALPTLEFRPAAALPAASTAPVGRRYYWRVRACASTRCSAWSPVRYVDVGRVPGDFDGDGYSDVAVGAISHSAGATLEGGVFVYRGSAGGPAATPTWRLDCPGNQSEAHFGVALAAAGDVNADGFDDLLVGAYAYDAGSSDEGAAFLFLGAAAGLPALPDLTLDSPAGQAGAAFGLAVGAAGDLDADGFADVVVAAPLLDGAAADEGRAYVYRGGAAGPAAGPDSTLGEAFAQAGAQLGLSAGSAGDVDGDGFADLVVGAPFYDASERDEGIVVIFRGGTGGVDPSRSLVWNDPAPQAGAFFGSSAAGVGDLDGDTFAELLVGAPGQSHSSTSEGNAFVLGGSAAGTGDTVVAWLDDPGGESGAEFGFSVAGAGDVDGDGTPDLVVGARYQDGPPADAGRAFFYFGSVSGPTDSADLAFGAPVPQDAARFGNSVGSAGDVDGDGFADVLIGEPLHDDTGTDEGTAYVYPGSAAGPAPAPAFAWTDPDHQGSAYFGYAVCRVAW